MMSLQEIQVHGELSGKRLMARSKLREEQVKDADFLSEQEHADTEHFFVSLADAPTTFSGGGGKYLRVNEAETAVEFDGWIEKSANYTAAKGDKIFLDSLGGPFTIWMPSDLTMGDFVSFIDGAGYCGTNNVTISGSGEKIEGTSVSGILVEENYAAFDLVFYNSTSGWIIK